MGDLAAPALFARAVLVVLPVPGLGLELVELVLPGVGDQPLVEPGILPSQLMIVVAIHRPSLAILSGRQVSGNAKRVAAEARRRLSTLHMPEDDDEGLVAEFVAGGQPVLQCIPVVLGKGSVPSPSVMFR